MAPFPLALTDLLGHYGSYIIYLIVGFSFGYVLEIAGFGNSKKLAAQFYFKDMTVLKVMFSAIIVAMVFIFGASAVGLLDYNLIWVNPTYLWPGIIGGLIMGVGFIVGGFCPGTSLVAAASGKIDGQPIVMGVQNFAYMGGSMGVAVGAAFVQGVEEAIKTIGLFNTKARNVIALSRILVEQHGGAVPADRDVLETLPGVGRKTANVVMNVAFGQPTIAVDTHIFRVANRTGLAPGKTPLAVEERLEKVVPAAWRLHAHHWLILHGRYICQARKPRCPDCTVRDLCAYKAKTVLAGAVTA